MLIGILQGLMFIFMALLLTVGKSYVVDWRKLKSGMRYLFASVAVAGLATAYVGTAIGGYYNLGWGVAAILFSLSALFTFESLLPAKGNN